MHFLRPTPLSKCSRSTLYSYFSVISWQPVEICGHYSCYNISECKMCERICRGRGSGVLEVSFILSHTHTRTHAPPPMYAARFPYTCPCKARASNKPYTRVLEIRLGFPGVLYSESWTLTLVASFHHNHHSVHSLPISNTKQEQCCNINRLK